MEPLGLSSGAAGLISLGISVSQGLLDYYRSWKDAEDQVAHMYGSIEALTETFSLLGSALGSKVFTPAAMQKVETSIRSAESGLHSLRKNLDKITSLHQNQDEKPKAWRKSEEPCSPSRRVPWQSSKS